ncbi:MAG TPA: hypothetical protein VMV45_03135, partial [Casimicrobiaceae bacterium]|nr:hypothetical protein [Casimicrobiaceae bacterium]
RVLAEPMLAPAPQAWTWYRSGSGGTFVKSPDGSAFAIDMPDPRELPDELVAALRQAMRRGDPVSQVDVAFDVDDATLARWTDALEVPFHRVTAWRWDEAPAAAFATAIDIREHATEPTTESVADRWRWFRPAFALAALALALHVGATFAQWVGLRWQLHRAEQSLMALAREANIPGVTDARSAAAGLATRYAQARHRAGLTAPDDALPLLARAAPALSIIPVEALRGATYSSGAWTFDMAKVDPAVLDRATATLAQSDVTAVEATSGAGVRIRVTP